MATAAPTPAARHAGRILVAVKKTTVAKSDGGVARSIYRGRVKPNEHARSTKIVRGAVVQEPSTGTGGDTGGDDNPTATASRADTGGRPSTSGHANPCTLVSRKQAQSILGGVVSTTEAPLGPTCIYQRRGAKSSVTLAVERLSFALLKPHIKDLSKHTIRNRAAYCGVYGSPVLYVPLSSERLLDVSAQCSVATE